MASSPRGASARTGPPAQIRPPASQAQARAAGMPDYLREAFLFRWNLLLLTGGAAAAVLTPLTGVLLPLVAAAEVAYLAGLVSIPRFRAAIDAKVHAAMRGAGAGPGARLEPVQPAASVVAILRTLPADARARFERLHA